MRGYGRASIIIFKETYFQGILILMAEGPISRQTCYPERSCFPSGMYFISTAVKLTSQYNNIQCKYLLASKLNI